MYFHEHNFLIYISYSNLLSVLSFLNDIKIDIFPDKVLNMLEREKDIFVSSERYFLLHLSIDVLIFILIEFFFLCECVDKSIT